MIQKIFEIFTGVGDWIATSLEAMTSIFWNAETASLTLLGTLGVIGVAFSTVFLIIGIIQRFLHFRG